MGECETTGLPTRNHQRTITKLPTDQRETTNGQLQSYQQTNAKSPTGLIVCRLPATLKES